MTKRRSWILACVCFLILAGISWGGRAYTEDRERMEYEIVCMGDSVLGQFRDEDGVVNLLAEKTGRQVFNGAFGGTNMSRINTARSMSEQHDSLSMAALSQAIANRDFGVQKMLRIKDNATEYFAGTVRDLSKIDFGRVEILFIEHGTNDYNSGVPLDNKEDPYDIYSFGGALRTTIRNIRQAYPDIRIILMTPTYSWFPLKEETCETWNTGYGYLEDYVNVELQIGAELGVEVIDNYHNLYPHDRMEDWETYTRDGLHLNEAGRRLLAETMADYLKHDEVAYDHCNFVDGTLPDFDGTWKKYGLGIYGGLGSSGRCHGLPSPFISKCLGTYLGYEGIALHPPASGSCGNLFSDPPSHSPGSRSGGEKS